MEVIEISLNSDYEPVACEYTRFVRQGVTGHNIIKDHGISLQECKHLCDQMGSNCKVIILFSMDITFLLYTLYNLYTYTYSAHPP